MKWLSLVTTILNPGSEALAGFHHGVPVQGPHQRLHFLEHVLDFV
jgi:hypothetical protein